MSTDQVKPRQSERKNKGQPPNRFGFEDTMTTSDEETDLNDTVIEPNEIRKLRAQFSELERKYQEAMDQNSQLQTTLSSFSSRAQMSETNQNSPGVSANHPKAAEQPLGGKLMPYSISQVSQQLPWMGQQAFVPYYPSLLPPPVAHSSSSQAANASMPSSHANNDPPPSSSHANNASMPSSQVNNDPPPPSAHATNTFPPPFSNGPPLPPRTLPASSAPVSYPPYIRKLQDLPSFSGAPEQWPAFHYAYTETTNAYGYTNLENLTRLQRALTGAAKDMVASLLIYPNNVGAVMNTLYHQYGRPEILIRSQIAKARAFPPIKYNKINEIIQFSVLTANLTAFLENCNAQPHLNNPTLLDELVSKLPINKREDWARYVVEHGLCYPTIKQFSLWIQYIAHCVSLALEGSTLRPSSENVQDKKNQPRQTYTMHEGTTKEKCVACHKEHKIYKCDKFRNMDIKEKWNLVKRSRMCFSCLRQGHGVQECPIKRECNINSCQKLHNRLLHEQRPQATRNVEQSVVANTADQNLVSTTVLSHKLLNKTLFKYLPVNIIGPKGKFRVVAFIDEGSTISLLEEDVANLLGIKGSKSKMTLNWIGDKSTTEISQKVDLEISGISDEYTSHMKNVRTVKNLMLPSQNLNLTEFCKHFPNLNSLPIENYVNAVPKILIGMPHINFVRPIEVLNINDDFAAHRTKLGWIVFGSSECKPDGKICHVEYKSDQSESIQDLIADFFTIDNFGVKLVKSIQSEDDKTANKILEKTTNKIEIGFETGLLWKDKDICMPDNYNSAFGRLRVTEKKLNKDEASLSWYRDKIADYVAKGYAKKLTDSEGGMKGDRTWYLPHFCVRNINKNKLRLVFDAAAQTEEVSLNSCLMKGPDKYQPVPLPSILFKFRQGKVGICGDIKEMFHRVAIRKEDQDSQRFLWRDCDETKEPEVYVMNVMIFGSASSPCSAQYVKNLNAAEYKTKSPRAVKAIVERHYVDDYVDSFNNVEEAKSVVKDVIEIHKKGNFELRGFVSNSAELMKNLNVASDIKVESAKLGRSENSEKILGLHWEHGSDTFRFVFNFTGVPKSVAEAKLQPTKRQVLSIVMSIFDPFGFIAHFVIKAKLLLQELWRTKTSWEDVIPEHLQKLWQRWYSKIEIIKQIRIPRNYHEQFLNLDHDLQLHVFVDASEEAYAAVAYWRIQTQDDVSVIFVMGKANCSPIKTLSVPRLELQAAVLGVRLKDAIVGNHDVSPSKIYFWSDSKTVISWIQSDSRRYKQFVAHRIAEILDSTDPEQWNWLPGKDNPADVATRMNSASEPGKWIEGPMFLRKSNENWPNLPKDLQEHDKNEEKRQRFVCIIAKHIVLDLIDQYSSYERLKKVLCWIYRAIQLFNDKTKRNCKNLMPLTAEEIHRSEMTICQMVQRVCFEEEITRLKDGLQLQRSSPLSTLTPEIDKDGILRLSGRIDNAACVGPMVRRPVILPKNHRLSLLIVQHYHEQCKHQNVEMVICSIRQKFWIPSLRRLVNTVKANCRKCKIRDANAEPPLMGQLPKDRLSPFVRPFTYTGLDYFGPVLVAIGRRQEKRWVALFTCMTMRAIHLELAKDLSSDAAIMCLKNFICRRGVPVRIRSDQGTNFIGASKEQWIEMANGVALESGRCGIEWIFNTPGNPSAGGAWERMVRSVKRVLALTLKEKVPQVETLQGLLREAENLINSRPLTHVPIDHKEAEPLTPNHFLIGCPNNVSTPAIDENSVCLKKQWHIRQQMMQVFWKRWVLEYLPTLTRRTKWHKRVDPIKVNDVVIVCDENESRGQWKKGLITEVQTSRDGQVRSAAVKTATGVIRRPASKLAVLDVFGES